MSQENTNPYLSEPADWIAAIERMSREVPFFQNLGLILEACIGGNEYCAYWLKNMFPNVFYVGTDIAPALRTINQGRADDGLTPEMIAKLRAGQEQLAEDDGNSDLATVRVNGLSEAFITSLKATVCPDLTLLVTYNGLVGLLGREYVPGERKRDEDMTSAATLVSSPHFDAQLHITESEHLPSLWEAPANIVTGKYYLVEKAAQELGIRTMRVRDGLIVIPPQSEKLFPHFDDATVTK